MPDVAEESTPTRDIPDPKLILKAILKALWPPLLLAPPVITVVFGFLIYRDIVPFEEDPLEVTALIVVPIGLAAAVVRYLLTRHPYFLWLAGLFVVILCREIHFPGTSPGFYVGMGVLLAIAWLKYPALAAYFTGRRVVTLFFTAFLCYFIGKSLDQHWWKMIPGEPKFERPLEEFMEVVGHGCAVLMVLLARKTDTPQGEADAETDPDVT